MQHHITETSRLLDGATPSAILGIPQKMRDEIVDGVEEEPANSLYLPPRLLASVAPSAETHDLQADANERTPKAPGKQPTRMDSATPGNGSVETNICIAGTDICTKGDLKKSCLKKASLSTHVEESSSTGKKASEHRKRPKITTSTHRDGGRNGSIDVALTGGLSPKSRSPVRRPFVKRGSRKYPFVETEHWKLDKNGQAQVYARNLPLDRETEHISRFSDFGLREPSGRFSLTNLPNTLRSSLPWRSSSKSSSISQTKRGYGSANSIYSQFQIPQDDPSALSRSREERASRIRAYHDDGPPFFRDSGKPLKFTDARYYGTMGQPPIPKSKKAIKCSTCREEVAPASLHVKSELKRWWLRKILLLTINVLLLGSAIFTLVYTIHVIHRPRLAASATLPFVLFWLFNFVTGKLWITKAKEYCRCEEHVREFRRSSIFKFPLPKTRLHDGVPTADEERSTKSVVRFI